MDYYLLFADEEWDRQISNDTSTFYRGPLRSVKEMNVNNLPRGTTRPHNYPLLEGFHNSDVKVAKSIAWVGASQSHCQKYSIVILKWWFLLLLPIPNKAEYSAKGQGDILVQIYALAGKLS